MNIDIELVKFLIQLLLGGGVILGLLQFWRDRRKASHETDNVAISGSEKAVETLLRAVGHAEQQRDHAQKREEAAWAEVDRMREKLATLDEQHREDLAERDKELSDLADRFEATSKLLEQAQRELTQLRNTMENLTRRHDTDGT